MGTPLHPRSHARRKLLFVSCGQESDGERALGRRLCALIDDLPHTKSFYADRVHSPSDLNAEVFAALNRCDAFVAVMHDRGFIRYAKYKRARRASVWIQQEIAIIAFRMFLLKHHIPIRVYAPPDLLLEGVMKTAIVNPIPFNADEEIVSDLTKWLHGHEFVDHPVIARRTAVFADRADALGDIDWLLLELIAAHTIKAGESATWDAVRNDFYAVYRRVGHANSQIEDDFNGAVAQLVSHDLVSRVSDASRGAMVLRIEAQWWDLVLDALHAQGRSI